MYKRILLAYDGTSSSAAALRQSVELARQCEAELHLLGVAASRPTPAIAGVEVAGAGVVGAYPIVNDFWGQDETSLLDALDTAARDLDGQGLSISTSIRFGNPGIEISNCANEVGADLVVIGHSGKGMLARLFGGSVGAELLNNLPCSLLVATGEA